MRKVLSQAELLEAWEEGMAHFNEGRYWHAHESWERGWVSLEGPLKLHIQALIQAAGVFHLMEKGRKDAACALAGLAIAKRERLENELGVQGSSYPRYPRPDIPGIETVLRALIQGEAFEIPKAVLIESSLC